MNFKSLMLFIVLGLMTFSSCKKDGTVTPNNVIEENKAKLVGTWNATESVDTGCTDSADNETLTFGCEREDGDGTIKNRAIVQMNMPPANSIGPTNLTSTQLNLLTC